MDEFKTSPLYRFFKAIGNLFRSGEDGSGDGENLDGFARADRVVKQILRFFCWLSAAALVIIMAVAFINVCGEKLVRAGVTWASGIPNSTAIIQYFHIPLVFLAAGYVTLDQGHTRIDLLIQKWPRVEKIFMTIGHVLGAALSYFISYRALSVTLVQNLATHARINTTSDSWLVWPFTVCHILGFFLLGCSFIWALVRQIRFWKYVGVNPGVYLYPDENHGPGAPGGPGNDAYASKLEDNAPVEEKLDQGGAEI